MPYTVFITYIYIYIYIYIYMLLTIVSHSHLEYSIRKAGIFGIMY